MVAARVLLLSMCLTDARQVLFCEATPRPPHRRATTMCTLVCRRSSLGRIRRSTMVVQGCTSGMTLLHGPSTIQRPCLRGRNGLAQVRQYCNIPSWRWYDYLPGGNRGRETRMLMLLDRGFVHDRVGEETRLDVRPHSAKPSDFGQ